MPVYRLMVGITGIVHVAAGSPEEAIIGLKSGISKIGVEILGKRIQNCGVTADVVKVVTLDDHVLQPDNLVITPVPTQH